MKFGIKCLQENAIERQYTLDFFFKYKHNTAVESATICDIRNYLAPNNSEIFRFSPNSEKMVNFQQGGLLDAVTK